MAGPPETLGPIRIVVQFDVQRLSPNLRLHWSERACRTRRAIEAAHFAWLMAGSPESQGPVTVDIIVRRSRRLDPFNASAAAKALIDGLFCRRRHGWGVTEDDSESYLRAGSVRQEADPRWRRREQIEFVISPVLGPEGECDQ